jgi:hypothetical protein
MPAGAGCIPRLDPFALPVRFTANDAGADGRVRHVEIDRGRVRLRRNVRGMAISVNVPVDAFTGVALRLVEPDAADREGGDAVMLVSLEHRDPALSLPLYEAADSSEIIAEWQSWARVLGLPLLIADRSGSLRQPFPTLGGLRIGAPGVRRRRRNAVKRRRASLPLRRRCGILQRVAVVRREREIIARS